MYKCGTREVKGGDGMGKEKAFVANDAVKIIKVEPGDPASCAINAKGEFKGHAGPGYVFIELESGNRICCRATNLKKVRR